MFRYRVPDLSGGNRKSSATDGGQSNWRHKQSIDVNVHAYSVNIYIGRKKIKKTRSNFKIYKI